MSNWAMIRPRPAQRGPQRDFPLPYRGSRQQKVRYIRAGDQKYQAHGAKQDQQQRPHVADHGISQRLCRGAFVGIQLVGKLSSKLFRGKLHRTLRSLERYAGFQPGRGGQVVRLVRGIRISLHRKPDFRRRVRREAPPKNSDHGVRFVPQQNGLAHQLGITTVAVAPQSVADDHHFRPSGAILFPGERSANLHRCTKHCKVARRDVNPFDLLRAVSPSDVYARTRKIVDPDALEHFGMLAPSHELRDRRTLRVSVRRMSHELHDAVWLGIGERL